MMSVILRGSVVALFVCMAVTTAKAIDPVTIQDPTSNDTVNLPGTATTFKVKFKIDPPWTFSSAKLIRIESDNSITNVCTIMTSTDVMVGGVYDHTEVTLTDAAVGTGYKINVRVRKMVANPYDELFSEKEVTGITITRTM